MNFLWLPRSINNIFVREMDKQVFLFPTTKQYDLLREVFLIASIHFTYIHMLVCVFDIKFNSIVFEAKNDNHILYRQLLIIIFGITYSAIKVNDPHHEYTFVDSHDS